jgi:hypothetical protein
MNFLRRLLESRRGAPKPVSGRADTDRTADADRAAARRYWRSRVAADESERGVRTGRP